MVNKVVFFCSDSFLLLNNIWLWSAVVEGSLILFLKKGNFAFRSFVVDRGVKFFIAFAGKGTAPC